MINKVSFIFKFILLLGAIGALFILFSRSEKIFAQTEECNTKEECEALLKKYEEEIAKYEATIAQTQKEKETLAKQISILKNKIDKLNLEIKQTNLMIKDLSLQIKDTEESINKTSLKIENYKSQISNILRTVYKEDQKSYIEILLADDELSDFFNNLLALKILNLKNQQILSEIKKLKSDLENQKEALDNEKEGMEKLVILKTLQKKESEETKTKQEEILRITKGKETAYQKYLKEIQEKAKTIRARLFELIGVAKAPTFGEAYELAKYVEGITGVRPAFLLAVLTQESNIGKNVGQCYLKDPKTGSGIVIKSGEKISKVMNPIRDVPYFLSICKELGRDPYKTPVSCPMAYGWGGAMGPAQFIPSTWIKYQERVKAITGSANPWDIKDSFLAAALYLADYGAANQTYSGEWQAAMIYFSGTINTKYRFYGDSVMRIASRYAEDIEKLEELAFRY